MTFALADVLFIIALALLVGIIGLGFGIFFVAPRLSRLTDRSDQEPDEEPSARPD